MELAAILKRKNISVYRCSKESNVPYTTLLDIVKGKTKIEKCTAETVYRLAKTLDVAMEELLEKHLEGKKAMLYRSDFETFKSNICHLVLRTENPYANISGYFPDCTSSEYSA